MKSISTITDALACEGRLFVHICHVMGLNRFFTAARARKIKRLKEPEKNNHAECFLKKTETEHELSWEEGFLQVRWASNYPKTRWLRLYFPSPSLDKRFKLDNFAKSRLPVCELTLLYQYRIDIAFCDY